MEAIVKPTAKPLGNSSDGTGNRLERIGAHSHIKGLGVGFETLTIYKSDDTMHDVGSGDDRADGLISGMVGQEKARKAAALLVSMMTCKKTGNQPPRGNHQEKKTLMNLGGRGVLLAGEPGTGKTAIAMGIAQSLGQDVPFTMLAGSELYSLDMSPTEALTQALRRSIGIRLGEVVEKLEGEVVELTIDTKLGISGGRSGKLTMRTTDMETIYDLGTKLIDALTREKVAAGDVIAIDKTNGKINKLGRSLGRAKDFDAVSAQIKWVSCPSGELLQKKKVEHVVTLHEIDVLNNNAGGGAVQALFSGATGEIRPEVRDMVDEKVVAWLEEGKASLLTGVLFIDEVHMLDLACFTFLHRAALASSLAPLLILASNKPDTLLPIRGAFGQKGAFGMPADFLDRLLIIPTVRYSTQELKTIISIRARQENVLLAPEALDKLTQLASEDCSLRYATLLISVAQLVAAKNKPKQQQNHNVLVQLNHIERAYNLFWDHKRSTKYCTDTFLA